jgi:MFS family permease
MVLNSLSTEKVNTFPVKATLLLVSTLTVMAGATIAPSLPAMREHFATVANADYWVRLVLTIPALFIALGAPLAGTIIDRFGRKPLLSLAVLLYGLAGASGFLLDSIGTILIGRVLLGLSVAGIMTTATTLIADYYVGAARAQFLGFQAAFMGLGGVMFLLLGGFLADVNWRFPFLIYLFALLIFPFILLVLPEPNRAKSATSPQTDQASATPLPFPWDLLILTYGVALIAQIVFYLIPTQLPFYLKQLVNASASQSGMAIALATLFSSVSAINYQRIKARLNFVNIYLLSFLFMGIGYVIISIAPNYGIVLIGLAIAGLGLGMLTPNMNVCLTSAMPPTTRGKVLGGLTTAFFLGQFISPIVSQPLSKNIGLAATYGWGGGLMLLLALGALVLLLRWK